MSWHERSLLVGLILMLSPPYGRAQPVRDRHVVVIALDGVRSDVLYRYVFRGEGNPPPDSFFRQLSAGAYQKHIRAQNAWSVFPSATFAAWATIFTGVYPGRHGIASGNFYPRDVGKVIDYGANPGVSELIACNAPASVQLYGWDIDCGELKGMMVTAAFVALPSLLSLNVWELYQLFVSNIGTVSDFLQKMPNPCVTIDVPILWPITIPIEFCLVNQYANGGSHNMYLLTPTLYDYLRVLDFRTYNIHNFANYSRIAPSGQTTTWQALYGSGLKGMDAVWARPSYSTNYQAVVITSPHDYKFFDKEVPSKVIQYIQASGMPHLMTLYLATADSESHQFKKFGHTTVEDAQFFSIRFIDQQLITVHNYLKSRAEYNKTIFLLIADHGHTANGKQVTHQLPSDRYMFLDDGFMAYVYAKNSKTGKWTDVPEASDTLPFLNQIAADPNVLPVKDLGSIMGRSTGASDYQPYTWDGQAWKPVDFTTLEDSPYEYLEPSKRVQGVNNSKRSGDFILLPACAKGCGEGTAFGATPSQHGSLRPSDSEVPFYIFGTPISQVISGASPWVLCGPSQIDVTPTILGLFNIYQGHQSALDGKPLLDSELRVNTNDFAPCRPSGVSDFLTGTWRNFQGEISETLLHNPSTVNRDAVLLYYGWDENLLGCQVVRLTPHGFVNIAPQVEGGGPLEIRAGPATKEPRPSGLAGYNGRRVSDRTEGFDQLAPANRDLFDIQEADRQAVSKCACSLLQQQQSPLAKLFCVQ